MAQPDEAAHELRASRLPDEMEAFGPVPLLDGIERRVHQAELKQSLARGMVAGRPLDANPRKARFWLAERGAYAWEVGSGVREIHGRRLVGCA
jgi:hypothetical protein